MSAVEVRQAHLELLEAAARLVDDLDELPAGLVLRCFSRAVRLVRETGCPVVRLAPEAERVARELLSARDPMLVGGRRA